VQEEYNDRAIRKRAYVIKGVNINMLFMKVLLKAV
jgi:hypothetical protein